MVDDESVNGQSCNFGPIAVPFVAVKCYSLLDDDNRPLLWKWIF